MKQQEKKGQEFDFIKEKIKDKPVNKRRLLVRGCVVMAYAFNPSNLEGGGR